MPTDQNPQSPQNPQRGPNEPDPQEGPDGRRARTGAGEGPPSPIPALVVSGFLGSGKTSLVRHLLAEAQRDGVRIAVVSNEMGELGIDRALLGDGGEAFVELEGGCVCCELSDDLIETLQELQERIGPDRIVIETSGVALPFDTQLNFWREPVSSWIGDDMAVVVVGADQLLEARDLEGTFTDQVSSADLLLLNKIDLVEAAAVPQIVSQLREIEPEAPIVTCTRGRVDLALLFPPELAGAPGRGGTPPEPVPHLHEHFETRVWHAPAGITAEALDARLQQPGLLRAKGFVDTAEGLRLVQVVGRRVELLDVPVRVDPVHLGEVVLISRTSADTDTDADGGDDGSSTGR